MNMKKMAAVVLAAAMTMGSTLTVFAAPESPVTTGSTEGEGKNEGHVEKKGINVVLPTMPETGSPFDYITDPERLIQGTEGAAHAGAKFPDAGTDTGVYFKVGENEYANTSKTLKVINKSSCNVAVTVTVEAVEKSTGNDLALAESATTTADKPLYLAVNVGSTVQVLSSTSTPVKKVIAGNADNFEITYTEDGGYAYTTKEDAINWKALEFNVTGAVNEEAVVTADTTAPTVKVTWNYAEATAQDTVNTADQVDYVDAPIVSFDYTGAIKIDNLKVGQTVTSVQLTFSKGSFELLGNQNMTWNADKTEGQMNSSWTTLLQGESVSITVTFSDDTTKTATAQY